MDVNIKGISLQLKKKRKKYIKLRSVFPKILKSLAFKSQHIKAKQFTASLAWP